MVFSTVDLLNSASGGQKRKRKKGMQDFNVVDDYRCGPRIWLDPFFLVDISPLVFYP
jgi:hypothetical protein